MKSGGSPSLMTTPVAALGPALVATIVYVSPLAWPGVGLVVDGVLVSRRSAVGGTTIDADASLLAGAGSGVGEPTVAMFVSVVALAVTVASIVIVTDSPRARSPNEHVTAAVHVPALGVATTSR